MVFLTSLIFANAIVYESVGGSLVGLDLDANHSSGNPEVNPYNIWDYTYGEYYDTDGFLGRYVYQGGPVTLTITQITPMPYYVTVPRFYYTHVDPFGNNDSSSWKEYVLLVRIKGELHDGNDLDFMGYNIIVEQSGDQVTIPYGAGAETVSVGEAGYDSAGNLGTYDGTNDYVFRYPFLYMWLDVTVLRTQNDMNLSSRWDRGYYSSAVQITGDGISNSLSYEGEVSSGNWTSNPDSFSFGIERVAPEYIPFTDLIDKTTLSNSYLAGYVAYSSPETSGDIGFYADPVGTSTSFYFSSTVNGVPVSIPYHVIFDPVISGNVSQPTLVSMMNNSFSTDYRQVASPIGWGQTSTGYMLTGEVRIILNPGLSAVSFPAATYSSTIYAIFTAD